MANNYDDATGVLVLNQVTPVIEALFGDFKLNAAIPGNGTGEVYISRMSECSNPQWSDILEGLVRLSEGLKLSLPAGDEGGNIERYLDLLSVHFNVAHDEVLGNLIENHPFEEGADLDALFEIAVRFDDGHGLKAIRFEGCWHSDKARLFEFGGYGEYIGRHILVHNNSSSVLSLGEELDAALSEGDVDKCAHRMVKEIRSILAGVSSDAHRSMVMAKIGEALFVV